MNEQAARLERLYREIGPGIRACLRRRMKDPGLADELLQETFLIATREAASLAAARSQRAWLMGIARNLFREQMRKQVRHRTVELPEDLATNAATKQDHRLDLIRAAIGELPEPQREVLELRLTDDLRYADIADMLDIPIGTVRSRLHHALRRLRSCVRDTPCLARPARSASEAPTAPPTPG